MNVFVAGALTPGRWESRARKDVVAGRVPTRRQRASGSGNRFHRAAQLDVLINQLMPCRPVLP